MHTICMDCQTTISGEPSPIVSHGICRPCFNIRLNNLAALATSPAKPANTEQPTTTTATSNASAGRL